MIIFRIVLSIISILGITWFSLPLFTGRILNIGNASGILIFFLLLLYSCFFKHINQFIVMLWSKIPSRIILIISGVVIIICIIFVIIETFLMISANFNTPSNGDTVIVLGCKVRGENASLMLVERLEAAYEFLTANDKSACILSGGKGSGEDISEAECMYRYLVDKGIDPQRLYKEDKSTSTRENLMFSKEIIDEYGLNSSVAIVTNEFHLYRAGNIAEALNLTYHSIPAGTAWWLLPTYYVRELFGIMYQWFL